MTDVAELTRLVNVAFLGVFLVLIGGVLASLTRRVTLYRRAELPVPVLVRRAIVLFGSLLVVGLEGMVLRALDVTLAEGSVDRLAYVIQVDLVLVLALLYFAKVEIFDLDDPNKT